MISAEIQDAFDALVIAVRRDFVNRFNAHLPSTAPTVKRGPGRPPGKARRKPPLQLCPVPRCANAAAPALGMLCAAHKNTPKRLVKKYREARRAAKAAAKARRP